MYSIYQKSRGRYEFFFFYLQAHSGVKGVVKDFDTRKGIANAIIHVKNITRVAKSFRRSDDVNHDITSVHDGDYWRLLTPGEYEIIAVADGYEPMAKLVEVLVQYTYLLYFIIARGILQIYITSGEQSEPTMYDFHDSTDTLKFCTEKWAINKTFLFFIRFR